MRDDEDMSCTAGVFNLLQNKRTAPGNIDTSFPSRWRILPRIGYPANIAIMKRAIHLFRGFAFPLTISNFPQPFFALQAYSCRLAKRCGLATARRSGLEKTATHGRD